MEDYNKTNDETYQNILSVYNDSKVDFTERDDHTIRMYERVTGKILEPEDREAILDQKRPLTEYNLYEGIRNAFAGTERLSRVNFRIVPEYNGKEATAYYLTQAIYHYKNRAHYEHLKSIQAMHAFIGGVAFAHNYWDFNRKRWCFKPLDATRIRWDKFTTLPTFEDCNWLMDTSWVTSEEALQFIDNEDIYTKAEQEFKQFEPYPNKNKFFNKLVYSQWKSPNNLLQDDFINMYEGRYRAIDYHERRWANKKYFENLQTRERIDVTGQPKSALKKFVREYGEYWEFRSKPEQEFWQVMVIPAIRMVIKESPYPYKARFFAFTPQVAYNVMPYIVQTQGVMDSYVNIIENFNKREMVKTEHAINTVGGDWIAEQGSVLGHEDDWETSERKRLRTYNTGFKPPVRDHSENAPNALYQLTNTDLQLLNEMLITRGYRGVKESANETGVLADTRIRQTEMMLQHILDNAYFSQELDTISLLDQIQAYVTEEEKIKLLDQEQYIMLNEETIDGVQNQLDDGEYGIEQDTARPSATAMQYAYNYMTSLLQYIPIDMVPIHEVYAAMEVPQKQKFVEWAKARYKAMGIDPDNLQASLDKMGQPMGKPPISQAAQAQEQASAAQQSG